MEEQLVEKSGRKKYMTRMEEAPENGKELPHSAYANGIEQNRIETNGQDIPLVSLLHIMA